MSQYPGKGEADFLALGDWNASCAECGQKRKASTMKQLPPGVPGAGMYVCPEHWNPRQPQDYVRGVADNMAAPWVQEVAVTYADFCTTVSSIADYAIADCSICDNPTNPEEGAV